MCRSSLWVAAGWLISTGLLLSTTGSTLVLILFGGLATTLGAVIALTLIINTGEWR